MLPTTTLEVIDAMTEIIGRARAESSRIGYFAALYRRVTEHVRAGIANNLFQNGPRMERFDVLFANRYLLALDQFRAGQPASRCWEAAFRACARRRPLIFQHLLLGMNAHINLDLGAAAAEVAPGSALAALKHDFDVINDILEKLIDDIEHEIAELSPWFGLIDRVGGREDEALINFSIRRARAHAWRLAQELVTYPNEADARLRERDREMTWLADAIEHPGPLVGLGLMLIRARESGDVVRNIDVLASP